MSLLTLMDRVGATSASAGRLVGLLESELAKPLLVHNDMIEEYARDMMKFGVDTRQRNPVLVEAKGVHVRSATSVTVTTYLDLETAVLDISGPLTNREINGPCMQSPVSYQAIRAELDSAVSDPRIKTIVVRVDSGGGAASNMVDLADYIRKVIAENPQIRFIASIDDMAASAAFGIVAAFPERYISRTGLAGSVGVVVRHTDRSEANAANGLSHTYIFAGANKVLGHGDAPLTDEARGMISKRVGMHYDLFADSVASGLGMTSEKVKATEANVYQGQDAVDIGFATGIMTFTEIIQSLESEKMTIAKNETVAPVAEVNETVAPVAEVTETVAPVAALPDAEDVQQIIEGANSVTDVTGDSTAADSTVQTNDDKVAADARRASIEAICDIGGVDKAKTAALIAGDLSAEAIATLVANSTASNVDVNHQTTAEMQGEKTSAETEKELLASWLDVLK